MHLGLSALSLHAIRSRVSRFSVRLTLLQQRNDGVRALAYFPDT